MDGQRLRAEQEDDLGSGPGERAPDEAADPAGAEDRVSHVSIVCAERRSSGRERHRRPERVGKDDRGEAQQHRTPTIGVNAAPCRPVFS